MVTSPHMNFRPTATNMVATVKNIIDGYRMGPLRALAQEPVQNSKDAAVNKNQTVSVKYELHERTLRNGSVTHMLTITDSGTKGLGGKLLDATQLASSGSVLPAGHDWVAFEGQGYTKQDEDALGSRGQGKAAFLYHSNPPPSTTGSERMAIIYDTLLPDGEYRLGIRYANPSDVTVAPPFLQDDARHRIKADWFQIDQGLEFPIALDPLEEDGTRIIVPFLKSETVNAIKNGELELWLQMCWWRAIQTQQLDITVQSKPVEVPQWWQGEPWKQEFDSTQTFLKEDIPIPDHPDMSIKRIVMTCSQDIPEHESTKEPEFDGVQLLRGGQWIETLGKSESWFVNNVPADLRPRFRGFVEFDRKLDRELRSSQYESPQHDDFRRQLRLVKNIVEQVGINVAEFGELAGWSDAQPEPGEISHKERQVFRQVMEMFVEPLPDGSGTGEHETNKPNGTHWSVRLDARYPNDRTTRVNWGQHLQDVTAVCNASGLVAFDRVNMKLEAVGPDQHVVQVATKQAHFNVDGTASANFGDIPFIKGNAQTGTSYVSCENPGRYRLRVSVESMGTDRAKANRSVYVQEDPPPPPKNDITVRLMAKNANHPERTRVNSGERLQVGIELVNRTLNDEQLTVDASLIASEVPGHLVAGVDTPGSRLLVDQTSVNAPGIQLAGEPPTPTSVFNDHVTLLDDLPPQPIEGHYLVLAPGRHRVQVDVRKDDEQVAYTSVMVWFEADPDGATDGQWPFELQQQPDDFDATGNARPTWWISQDSTVPTKLFYNSSHPLYRAAAKADEGSNRQNPGTKAYLGEICSDALIDWMLEPYLENKDESRLVGINSRKDQDDKWSNLAERIERFASQSSEPDRTMSQLAEDRRTIVSAMVRILGENQ